MEWTNIEKWFYIALTIMIAIVITPFITVYCTIKYVIDLVKMACRSRSLDEFITKVNMHEG